jgi:N6-adenosine-specific RNA methylase IME4
MADLETKKNPGRKCKRNQVKPKASYYVGYVDDHETPEMIMAKFGELEKIQEQSKNPTEGTDTNNDSEHTLGEEQLEKLFQKTSNILIPEVMGQGMMIDNDGYLMPDYDDDDSDMEENYFGNDESAFWNDRGDDNKGKKSSGGSSNNKKRKKEGGGGPKTTKMISMEVVGADGYTYTIKKKVTKVDPFEPAYMRIPSVPIPPSWARTIAPWNPVPNPIASTYIETDIMEYDFTTLNKQYMGALIDVPWLLPKHEPHKHRVPALDLYKLRLDKIMPFGFIFIWVENETIADSIRVMKKWDFHYVENLSWIRQRVNNAFLEEDAEFCYKSKSSLLIFKKGDLNCMQLRHQRNPDVIYDFVLPGEKYLTDDKPVQVYDIIETLLPDAVYKDEKNPGKLLEVWAKKGTKRTGWTTIVQKME